MEPKQGDVVLDADEAQHLAALNDSRYGHPAPLSRECPMCSGILAKLPQQTGAERYLAGRLADPEYRRAYEEARAQ